MTAAIALTCLLTAGAIVGKAIDLAFPSLLDILTGSER